MSIFFSLFFLSSLATYQPEYSIYQFERFSYEDLVVFEVAKHKNKYFWREIYYPGFIKECEISKMEYNEYKKLFCNGKNNEIKFSTDYVFDKYIVVNKKSPVNVKFYNKEEVDFYVDRLQEELKINKCKYHILSYDYYLSLINEELYYLIDLPELIPIREKIIHIVEYDKRSNKWCNGNNDIILVEFYKYSFIVNPINGKQINNRINIYQISRDGRICIDSFQDNNYYHSEICNIDNENLMSIDDNLNLIFYYPYYSKPLYTQYGLILLFLNNSVFSISEIDNDNDKDEKLITLYSKIKYGGICRIIDNRVLSEKNLEILEYINNFLLK